MTGGGTKDLTDKGRYFLAVLSLYLPTLDVDCKDDSALVALNAIVNKNGLKEGVLEHLQHLSACGKKIYLDSGCYTIANDHAKAQGLIAGDVFMSSPSELPFFEEWLAIYNEVVPIIAPYLWGYVEVDFGSYQDRIATRQRVYDQAGLVPIPVYRCGREPISVFTDLLKKYDRICVAGTLFLSPQQHSIAYNEMYEQWKTINPDCYIHTLGIGAFGSHCRFNFPSCDSSTFSSDVRYGSVAGYCYTGITSAAVFSPRFAVGDAKKDIHSDSMPIGGRLGVLRHSIYNIGRKAHLDELDKLTKELKLSIKPTI